MRTVRLEGVLFNVTQDPNQVIGEFLGYAVSLKSASGRPAAEELAERFSPKGKGMRLPDVFAAYRAEALDDLPEELTEQFANEVGRKELWVLTRLQFGKVPASAVVEGNELRRLLNEAVQQRAAKTAS
jgi:Zn-dependent oligopeptidase